MNPILSRTFIYIISFIVFFVIGYLINEHWLFVNKTLFIVNFTASLLLVLFPSLAIYIYDIRKISKNIKQIQERFLEANDSISAENSEKFYSILLELKIKIDKYIENTNLNFGGISIKLKGTVALLTFILFMLTIYHFSEVKDYNELDDQYASKVDSIKSINCNEADKEIFFQSVKASMENIISNGKKNLIQLDSQKLGDTSGSDCKEMDEDNCICVYTFAKDEKKKNGPIWVFLLPEFQQKFKTKYGEMEISDLRRVQQLMGFSFSKPIHYVHKLRVKTKDLVRPMRSYNPFLPVNDPVNGNVQNIEVDRLLQKTFLDNFNNRTFDRNAPFTAGGYTFDWCPYNPSHIGVTEFVILDPDAAEIVEVESFYGFIDQFKESKK